MHKALDERALSGCGVKWGGCLLVVEVMLRVGLYMCMAKTWKVLG